MDEIRISGSLMETVTKIVFTYFVYRHMWEPSLGNHHPVLTHMMVCTSCGKLQSQGSRSPKEDK